jgi:hypothetical protein
MYFDSYIFNFSIHEKTGFVYVLHTPFIGWMHGIIKLITDITTDNDMNDYTGVLTVAIVTFILCLIGYLGRKHKH